MKDLIETISIIGLAVVVFVLNVLFNVVLAAGAVWLFDWLMGTAYFSAQVVGIVALISYVVGRIGK